MSKQVTIYRIQSASGKGPYRGIQSDDWQTQDHWSLPSPLADTGIGGKFKFPEQICGFKSLQQLTKWFTKKEVQNLAKKGFKIYAIKIPSNKCIRGKRQLVFEKKFMKQEEVLKVSISSLFPSTKKSQNRTKVKRKNRL